jgi:hypothetical protein
MLKAQGIGVVQLSPERPPVYVLSLARPELNTFPDTQKEGHPVP